MKLPVCSVQHHDFAGFLSRELSTSRATNFALDNRQHKARLRGKSAVIQTQFGQLEYAEKGAGPPFLMIHGTGGGFDQGLNFTEGLSGFRVIAPSRFDYLRSDFPADPSSQRQVLVYSLALIALWIA